MHFPMLSKIIYSYSVNFKIEKLSNTPNIFCSSKKEMLKFTSEFVSMKRFNFIR